MQLWLISSGTITVNSVLSNDQIQFTLGSLTVTDTMQVNNTFLMNGVSSFGMPTFTGTLLRGSAGQGLTVKTDAQLTGARSSPT